MLDPLALDLHFLAQGIADVVVEASDVAIRSLEAEGRIGGFDTEAQGVLAGEGEGAEGGEGQGA
ncbi:hypothetical protein D3C81_2275130 [compost metagenome]